MEHLVRELTYFVAVSLDGRISGPADDFSAFPVTGDHMDHLFDEWTDTLPAVALEALGLQTDHSRFDCVLMGWNTYAAAFPQGVRDPYPHHEQVVFSRTRGPADVAPGIRLSGDPVQEVRRLKQADGSGIWLCGGGVLADALSDDIDRLVLKVNPIVLGEGPTLFSGAYRPRSFGLTRTTAYDSGVVINEYRR